MNSFSVIADSICLKNYLLEHFKKVGLEIIEIDSNVESQKIYLPNLVDQFGNLQYALLYFRELKNEDINQYDAMEKEVILSKNFKYLFIYSFDYNLNKAFELICYLVDTLIKVVLIEELEEQVIFTDDLNGGIYNFREFYQYWIKKRGFFLICPDKS